MYTGDVISCSYPFDFFSVNIHPLHLLYMFMMLALLLLPLVSLSFAPPTTEVHPRQTKPYQIRGVEDPIYHLYLQALPGSKSTPVMGPVATSEYFVIGDTIQSTNTSMYLNIGTSTTSYLPLSFNNTASTTAWGLEGDTIITESTSSYGRRKFQKRKRDGVD
jgi:hypothetical protein